MGSRSTPAISTLVAGVALAATGTLPVVADTGTGGGSDGAVNDPEPTRTITSAGNPIVADGSYYLADAAPLVVDDTLYIYGGHDEAEPQQAGFEMHEYGVLASTDPEGESWDLYEENLRPGEVFDWATGNAAYAGQVVAGEDGRFYFYAPVESVDQTLPNRMAIGVAVADTPVGPWSDAIGAPLVDWRDVFGEATTGEEVIDPHVFVDTDGSAYLYWGSWGVARMAPLDATMTALAGEIVELDGPDGFYEAPWVLRRDGTYYMLYDWKVPGSDCTPSNYQACVAYATAEDPAGPWTFQDIVLGGTSATTVHPSLVEIGDSWYLTYHTKDSEGGGHFRRSVAIDEVTWDGPEILPVEQTWAEDPDLVLTDNLARSAQPSASYTETPPMRVGALNDGRAETAMLPPDQWGNYRSNTSTVASDWVMYTWDTPVRTDSVGIELDEDGDGILAPTSWQLEYVDADGTWHPVRGADYPTDTDTWHTVTFDAVTTTALRATFTGQTTGPYYHAVAVSEWEVYAVPAEELPEVVVETAVGEEPDLPPAVRMPFDDAGPLWVPVRWEDVPDDATERPGTLTVTGTAQGQAAEHVQATVTITDEPGLEPGPDEEVPTASVLPLGSSGEGDWFPAPVTVRVTGTDETDYLLTVQGRTDEEEWQSRQEARHLDLTISEEGSTTIAGRVADGAGNVSATVERTVRVDTTAPELTAELKAQDRTVAVTAADALSGLAALEYRFDDGRWQPVDRAGAILVPDDQPHELLVRARDRAGNETRAVVDVPPEDGATLTGNIARYAEPSASYTTDWESVEGLNDGRGNLFDATVDPGQSWGTWNQVGTQWAQLDWQFDVTTDEIGVWWYRDGPDEAGAGMIPPRSWTLAYLDEDGQTWHEVRTDDDYARTSDGYARLTFDAVTTRALRIVAESWGEQDGGGSVGIREWQVAPAGGHETVLAGTAAPRCLLGTGTLYLQVRNIGDTSLDVHAASAAGSASLSALSAGATRALVIETGATRAPAGSVQLTAYDSEQGTLLDGTAVDHGGWDCG